MKKLIVQLNHPGIEKKHTYRNKFLEGRGYYKVNSQLIREWNNDSSHYRKFIRHSGSYLENLNSYKKQIGKLLFWGEWEGYSKFFPLNSNHKTGIHEPFHSTIGKGSQNTDPYVFGDCFKYAICKQDGIMTELAPDSLILFGTTIQKGFLLDSVFIVKDWETADSVSKNKAQNYTQTYRDVTLSRLGHLYLGKNPSKENKIYHAKMWDNELNNDLFSYVPCKIEMGTGTNRVLIPFITQNSTIKFSKQRQGHPYKIFLSHNVKDVWKYVTKTVLSQGFVLGIRFEEPNLNNTLAKHKRVNPKELQSGCFPIKYCIK